VGAGRKLTQTGRITLADARELVVLLGTEDEIDPKIGDRVFRTKSSEELHGITTVVEWAKASGLVRVTSGRLVTVKKHVGLLDRPLELWARMFEVFPRLGAALCPSGWGESLLRRPFKEGVGAVLAGMGRCGGAIGPAEACALAWETVTGGIRSGRCGRPAAGHLAGGERSRRAARARHAPAVGRGPRRRR
jgi:hypothetical protein